MRSWHWIESIFLHMRVLFLDAALLIVPIAGFGGSLDRILKEHTPMTLRIRMSLEKG